MRITNRTNATSERWTVDDVTLSGTATPSTPTITGFTPTSGPVGQVITITGTNLGTITGGTVNGTAATFGSASATSVTLTVASGTTGTGQVVLSDGTTTYTAPGTFTVDGTPPTFASGSPSASAITTTGFTLSSTIDEVGKTYYVVLPSGAAAPTVAQVKAGTGNGTAALQAGTITNATANAAATAAISGLSAGTAYDVYLVAEDAAGNVQNSSSPLTVTTTALTPTITLTGNTFPAFNTVAGTPSAAQSVTVEGANLIADITIAAVAGYEFSVTSATTGFAPSQALTPTGGTVAPTTLYVRLTGNTPTASLGTPLQATSPGATTRTRALSGTVVPEPTTQPTVATGAVGGSSVVLTVAGGDGTNRLLVVRDAATGAVVPVDKTTYTANAAFGNTGTGTTTSAGNYVVLTGTVTTVTVTGLTPNTSYVAEVYAYNAGSAAGFENYLTTTPGTASFITGSPELVVISQVYGAGGNSNAAYTNDYVELFNRGTSTVDLSSYFIAYYSNNSTATTPSTTVLLTGSIAPGKYYLIKLGGGSTGSALPTPDATGGIDMGGSAGRVELFNGTLVDRVGYGSGTGLYEGTGRAPAPSASNAIFRANGGCTDTNDNAADFAAAAAAPRNSATAANTGCGVPSLTATTAPATSPTSISGLSTTAGTPSAAKTYTLNGSNLGTTPVTVTAPAGFQVSTTAAFTGITADANSVSITPVGGSINSQTIYVRLTGTTAASYSGTVTNTNGALSAPVLVSGVVNPVVTASLTVGALNAVTFTTIAGVPSTPARFYTLSGSGLTSDVTVTAPTNFEVSATSATTGFATSLTLTPAQVNGAGLTLYVRLSGTSVGTANGSNLIMSSGNITHTSSGAASKTLALDGTIVIEPTVSSGIAATNVGFNSATINLSNFVAGTGTYALVVVRNSATAAVAPTDQTTYTANPVFGNNGTTTITGPGNYVVLKDADVTVTVTGLSPTTAYTADVYDYNSDNSVSGVTFENYKPVPRSVSFTTTAAPLVNYDFTGTSVAASYKNPNVTAANFERGSGITANNTVTGVFGSTGYASSGTLNPNNYVGFSMAPAPGYRFTLTTLDYTDSKSTAGPTNIEVRYSLDAAFTNPVTVGTVYNPSTTTTARSISLGSGLTNVQGPVYFRIYGYGNTGIYRIDDVNVFGTVEVAPLAPEINLQTATGTDLASGSTYGFGAVQPGSTATATFTVQNLGTTDLALNGTPAVQFEAGSSPEFTITAQPGITTIAGGGSTTFTVTYTPVAATAQTATLIIANNDSDEDPYRLVLTGTLAQPYVWNGSGTSWAAATSWTPARTTAAPADVLVFDGNVTATAAATVDFTTAQTVAQLIFRNSVQATLNTDGTRTLTIANGNTSGADLVVGAGSALTLTNPTANTTGLTVQLSPGATASIGGSVVFDNGNQRLQATTAGSIEFVSGSLFRQTANMAGSPFGATNANINSVIFRNGSRLEQAGGSQPFGITGTNSVIVLEPTSQYVFSVATPTSFPPVSNRTYGNLELSVVSGNTASSTASGALTIAGNLTVTSGNVALNLTSTISVAGNIVVNGTSTLTFSPASAGTLTLNGTTPQTIGGTAPASALTFGPNLTLQINNGTGVTLARPLTLSRLALTSGVLTTDAANRLTLTAGANLTGGGSSSYVAGPLARASAAGASSLLFPIGKAGKFLPATLAIAAQDNPTTYVAELFNTSARTSTLTAPLTRVSGIRYVNITPEGGQPAGFSGTITLSFDTNDEVTDPADAMLVIAKRSLSTDPWINIDRSASTGTASNGAFVAGTLTSGTFTSFSDFALASLDPDLVRNPLPVELTAFKAQQQAEGVLLKWTTASEHNSARFEVQRSADGRSFGPIASVEAQGQSTQAHTYSALDRQPLTGTSYYRLRQIDRDGKTALSPVVAVAAAGVVTLFPNPTCGPLYLQLPAAAHYRVLNSTGSVVLTGEAAEGVATLSVTPLPAGLYQLEVVTAAGRTVRKFIKEN
ncbi:Por secretion system C-terminal sorting domain-containing protein [Hymenobacter daecheongensis DSM 21074]|uniref:Por secretion system C-terminal sorting domain-containing protein n=1 Tax=Hymenobacter daecheongensis DSM 21074 TaxID=1121955 RepID=A0A1M6F163_9BACT|nr:Por secretion system C-terminal sorting domain-containing protein [Hymenobacter daecheongensis DSM 21074]